MWRAQQVIFETKLSKFLCKLQFKFYQNQRIFLVDGKDKKNPPKSLTRTEKGLV
jgi:hypothetical protein